MTTFLLAQEANEKLHVELTGRHDRIEELQRQLDLSQSSRADIGKAHETLEQELQRKACSLSIGYPQVDVCQAIMLFPFDHAKLPCVGAGRAE